MDKQRLHVDISGKRQMVIRDSDEDKRGNRSCKGDGKGGRDLGGKREGTRFEKGDKGGGLKGDKRGGRDFGGKRGGKRNFSVDFDDED